MKSELKHSKKLSKRFKKDFDFKSILFPELKVLVKLENGIMQVKHLKKEESIFSEGINIDTDEEIEKCLKTGYTQKLETICKQYKLTQSLLSQKRVQKSKWYNKTLFITPILNGRNPNPITKFRYLEYVFYLDSDIFRDADDKIMKEFKSVHDIYDYKRASSVIFDKNNQCFIIKVHEKDEGNDSFNLIQQNYYIDWLQSMGNSKAMNLIEILIRLKQYNEDHIKQIPQYAEKYSKIISKENSPKQMIKEIDEKTKKYILSQPCVTRLTKIDLFDKTENTGLIEEEYNMAFVKMLGYREESDMDELMAKFLKLDIQKSWYTKQSYNNIYDMNQRLFSNPNIKNKSDPTKPATINDQKFEGTIFNERFYVKNNNGDDAFEFRIVVYEEKWFQDKSLYKKSYQNFFDIKYISHKNT